MMLFKKIISLKDITIKAYGITYFFQQIQFSKTSLSAGVCTAGDLSVSGFRSFV